MSGETRDAGLPGPRLPGGPRPWVRLALLVALALAFVAFASNGQAVIAKTAPAPGSGLLSEAFQATPAPDLSVSQTVSPNPASAGGTVGFSISVTNQGSLAAHNVVLLDSLSAGASFISTVPDQGSCQFLQCHLGSIAAGASVNVTLFVRADGPAPRTISSRACVSANPADDNGSNDCNTKLVLVVGTSATPTPTPTPPPTPATRPATSAPAGKVTPPPRTPGEASGHATPTPVLSVDLVVTKIDSPDPAPSGGILTFAITVTNRGSETAHNVKVQDTLPSGVSLISTASSQGTCSEASCSLGDIPAGLSAAVALVVEIEPDVVGTLSDTACATADGQTTGASSACDQETTTIGVAGSGSPTTEPPSPLSDTSTPSAAGGDDGGGGSSWVWWVLLSIAFVLLIGGGLAVGLSRRRKTFPDLYEK